ncbi:XisH protein [Gloeothece citriformis PCC 7424]|uniref:XisH protein n=1 Tax=Gloeothece citriformis (strain PCC 7424) TaxID=65393 RepID=B7KJH5_GLOC7|nr:XisH family protein [Gloeothece citriformis]ACK73652.1 XisH protein [Gloeothece citriformis PCC 7424]
MAAKDIYHDTVKRALEKDGWTITNDPLTLKIGRRSAMVDLGAEKLLAAEKEQEKIAVEIKSFLNPSPLNDLENAPGQFILYSKILSQNEPDRTLYLAVNRPVFNEIFSEEVGQLLLETTELRLIVFNSKTEEIIKWIT